MEAGAASGSAGGGGTGAAAVAAGLRPRWARAEGWDSAAGGATTGGAGGLRPDPRQGRAAAREVLATGGSGARAHFARCRL